ncbi:transport-associated protein [Richelia sinica FACHB-800]|uniref:Transport-associated protein n=1 Tax=Richelia sinica FACHB-800 TaxID=1357546 RepID=A0A975T5L8_9NOST|nr:BON domain-containing protein [Richelia sinica]MBD2663024.1 BON domain-containing protein [Richelia sinica FACHB-800]QXE21878.1 transport-associated protein [Richelia sinica FACHB-800]
MNKLKLFLITSVLLVGTVACENPSKTTTSAPNSQDNTAVNPDVRTREAAQSDAQSDVRRRQLNSDIRAREERNNNDGGSTTRASTDLASEVRSKLEANIPDGQLTVNATDNGDVTVLGTVNNQEQLAKIEPLAKEIKGVRNVIVKASIAQPKS